MGLGSTQTSTSTAEPWEPTQNALQGGIRDLRSLYQSGGLQINPYQGDMVANAPQELTDAQNGLLGMVPGAVQSITGAQDFVSGVASNAGMDAQRQNVINTIMPAINGTFAGSGMTGSSLHQQNLSQGLASGLAEAEQGFTAQALQAAGMVPGLAMASMDPYRSAIDVGTDRRNLEQAEIDALVSNDLMAQGSEANALRDYLSILSGIGGQFSTQTNVQQTNPGLLGIAGAGLQGASLFL